MIDAIEDQPLIALADDDTESARTMLRSLAELGLRRAKWHGDAERSLRLFAETFREQAIRWPSLIVVDLKSDASATADFIRTLIAMAPAPLLIAAMAPNLERSTREALIDAGATAVFEHRTEPSIYQREIASLVGFLDRHLTEAGSLSEDVDGDLQFAELTIGTNPSPTQDPEQGAQ